MVLMKTASVVRCVAQPMFEVGEELFDRVQVG
jgi:hypothetical protein